ncbi:Signal recognition particle receptor FtsY [archaeon HR06]|nr:Signal recognition particle receptor FtsY [archaeon HR06]
MLTKIKKAFENLINLVTQKTLDEKTLDELLDKLSLELIEGDVALEVVEELKKNIKEELIGKKVNSSKEEEVRSYLAKKLKDIFPKENLDIIKAIKEKVKKGEPYIVLFLGINGTGKTTTLAKLANFLKKQGFSLIITCSDTYRAGAIEQLQEHANRLKVKFFAQKYGADPAAVARDSINYAKAHKIDVVLIDTAGRMQTNKNLMDEMNKIIRVVKPDLKIFVGDSLAGNDAINQAKEFLTYTNFDATILTKMDADTKGGSALSIAYITKKPILFLGTGQGYEDLIPFDIEKFIRDMVYS